MLMYRSSGLIWYHRIASVGGEAGAWVVGPKVACDIVDAYLAAEIGEGFNDERRRVQAEGYERIKGIEKENFK